MSLWVTEGAGVCEGKGTDGRGLLKGHALLLAVVVRKFSAQSDSFSNKYFRITLILQLELV